MMKGTIDKRAFLFINYAFLALEIIKPTSKNAKKTTISTATIVGPTGVPRTIESNKPVAAANTEIIAELMVTDLKLLNTRIALSAGKIIKADINNEPTRFIAKTIITAVIIAINKLYKLALTPVALAKFSSKVTANILL